MSGSNNNNNSSGDDESVSKEGGGSGSGEGGSSGGKMKKGPWTLSEDAMLREYVMKYGEGNWNSVQKNSGLARCGKSCRLRWANHLRPNLKKGAFSKEEEQIIIHLHAKLGNKWARMASQLPGRTDNEIKNFWNTRVKRCQRAGLSLYPPSVLHEANGQHVQQEQPYYTCSSSFSFSPLLNETSLPCSPNTQQFKFPYENKSSNGINMGFPLSPNLPYGSSSSSLFNQSHHSRSFYSYDNYEPLSLPLLKSSNTAETSLLSQISSPPSSTITPTSSYASGIYGLIGGGGSSSNMGNYKNNGCYEVAPLSPPQGNSGLLDAIVAESQSVCRNDKLKSEDCNDTPRDLLSHKRKKNIETTEQDPVLLESAPKKEGNSNNKIRKVDLNSSQFSIGNKPMVEEGLEGINSMDDDLFGLLNNFQEMAVPDWYRKRGQPLGFETQQHASLGPSDQDFATNDNFWRNIPDIL